MTLNLPKLSLNPRKIKSSICRSSLFEFTQEMWPCVSAEVPVWNWHVPYLCSEIQVAAERVFGNLPKLYDLIINVPPATTKSTIASVMFPAWAWTRMASARVIGASYSGDLSMDLSRKSRDVIKSDRYRELFPEVEIRDDQDSKGYFVNKAMGDRFSAGVNGSVTGMHGHFIVVDDPLNPNQAYSDADMKAANRWMTETLPSRKVNPAVTLSILIMQRLHQYDPTAARLEKSRLSKVRHICLPAELSAKVGPPELAKRYVNGLLDPIRLSKEVLAEKKEDLADYGYAGQYMQDPVPRGGAMFHVQKLKYPEATPDRWRLLVRYWDKAGTQDGGAYTAGVLMGMDLDGYFWVLDVVRGRWDAHKRETLIRQTAELDGRHVHIGVEQEPGSGGKESAESTVRRLAGFRVMAHKVGKADGDKVARAYPFAAQVNGGNVYVKKAYWNTAYLDEMTFFPMSRYKDQIDASSGAFNKLATPRVRIGGL